jgi:hypothetical protein
MALVGKQQTTEPTTANNIAANMETAIFEAGYAVGLRGEPHVRIDGPTLPVSEGTLVSIVSNLVQLAREGWMPENELEEFIHHDCGMIAGLVVRGEHSTTPAQPNSQMLLPLLILARRVNLSG